MLTGTTVGLRARHEEDIPILLTELYEDVAGSSRAEGGPWRPVVPWADDPRLKPDPSNDGVVAFSVVELGSGALIGSATVWGIDTHNRNAHLGLGLVPAARAKGYGTETVALLCRYGFVVRGLRRLQLETLEDNHAMLRAAERNGFVREGRLRSSSWVMGEFLDDVVLGLLAEEWSERAAD
jgi:RimJ/RimL family protein N-acetyltransferase